LVELEVLAPQDAARWAARLRTAADDDGRVISAAAGRVTEHLAHSLESDEPIEAGSERALWLNGVFGAALALRTFPSEDDRAWHLQLARRIGPSTTPPPPQYLAELDRQQALAAAAVDATDWQPRRVVAGPDERRAGIRVTSVEIAGSGLRVRWHYTSPDGSWPREASYHGGHFRLTDDQGTDYFGRGGGGTRAASNRGESAVIVGHDAFTPAPAPSVRRLIAFYRDEPIEIELGA
jgi:hypothetical protein